MDQRASLDDVMAAAALRNRDGETEEEVENLFRCVLGTTADVSVVCDQCISWVCENPFGSGCMCRGILSQLSYDDYADVDIDDGNLQREVCMYAVHDSTQLYHIHPY